MKRKNRLQLKFLIGTLIYSILSGLVIFLSEYADGFRIILPMFISLMLVVGVVVTLVILSVWNAIKRRTNLAGELLKGSVLVSVIYILVSLLMSFIFSSF